MDAQYFDTRTTNGSALVNTIPAIVDPVTQDALTPIEVTERVAWSDIRTDLVNHYRSVAVTALRTVAEFLEQRVAPPLLSTAVADISGRESLADSRADRRDGPNMRVWEDFEQNVRDFSPDELESAEFTETLRKSLNMQRAVKAEKGEQQYLFSYVLLPLQAACLLDWETGGTNGEDVSILQRNSAVDTVTAVVELKSSHNMLLPASAQEVADLYNEHCRTARTNDISADAGRVWSRIGHPVGQTVGYMENKRVKFVAVSSGTRTFFLHLRTPCAHSLRGLAVHDLYISGPWLVGQPNYLKAWAYFAHQAESDAGATWNVNTDAWFGTLPKKKGKKDNDEDDSDVPPPAKKQKGNKRSKKARAGRSKTTQRDVLGTVVAIPLVSVHEIERIRPLGEGSNGTVFLGVWQGQHVAIKQFDVSKSGGRNYEREIAAYVYLFSAWGCLVPKPLFRCEYFPYNYIGVQLGRKPDENDHDVSASWRRVLRKLETDYNFRHLDVDEHDGNMLFIKNEDGGEQLVAIDLEWYEILE